MCIRDRYQRRVRGKGVIIMADRNAVLMDRIAKAEAELQNVMSNRSTLDHVHQDTQSKDRWQTELQARMEDLEHSDKFATETDLWNKDGEPHPPKADDVESFAQAVMDLSLIHI
eukprot:TRINITY_DN16808_c0_g1_i2.p2 TRINITY_DN16808_c0_g1~~TRINITY_DN16808_c0_g1_i2.p2  ORF type:complete len:114 (-),score=38.11 TRINITY_DN16808_c0_g1_i2:149-490(-)